MYEMFAARTVLDAIVLSSTSTPCLQNAAPDVPVEYRKYKAPIHLFQPGIVHPPLLVLLVLALLQTPMPLNPA